VCVCVCVFFFSLSLSSRSLAFIALAGLILALALLRCRKKGPQLMEVWDDLIRQDMDLLEQNPLHTAACVTTENPVWAEQIEGTFGEDGLDDL
jgi:hypothetical protein